MNKATFLQVLQKQIKKVTDGRASRYYGLLPRNNC